MGGNAAKYIARWNSGTTSIAKGNVPNGVEVYPNPSSGKFAVKSNAASVVEIYNITGQLLFREAIAPGEELTVDLKVPSGIYFCRTISSQGTLLSTKKCIIH